MTKIAYFQCPTGIAGDMCLGALVDAGVPLDYLATQLKQLGISGEFTLRAERVQRSGQAAIKVHVDLHVPANKVMTAAEPGVDPYPTFGDTHSHPPHSHPPHDHRHDPSHEAPHHDHSHDSATRHLPEIEQMILAAGLPPRAESWSLTVFRQLAEAEGAVHGIPPSQVHFHEVGATDAIVDIVGTCLGLNWLGIEQLYCSPMPTGGGTVRAAHGRLPVPTPAVLRLWEMRQVPIYSNGIERELVTPTGAAIATTLATHFGAPPAMTLLKVGLGAGSRDLPIPNLLRLWVGETRDDEAQKQAANPMTVAPPVPSSPTSEAPQETITVLETQIDDASPQVIAYASERLFAAGAVDVFSQAIAMKKSRLGTLVTVICPPEAAIACEAVLFEETTTLGVRRSTQQRTVLLREIQTVETEYGRVRIKVARRQAEGPVDNAQPEYEDCAQLARQRGISWKQVHRRALEQFFG